jgi:hypothetical protein
VPGVGQGGGRGTTAAAMVGLCFFYLAFT